LNDVKNNENVEIKGKRIIHMEKYFKKAMVDKVKHALDAQVSERQRELEID